MSRPGKADELRRNAGNARESMARAPLAVHEPAGPDPLAWRSLPGVKPVAGGLVDIPLGLLRPDPDQPRKTFDQDSLALLGTSLARKQLQPILVRPDPAGGGFVVVVGGRRLEAARLAGLSTLQATIAAPQDSQDLLADQLTENMAREDLPPMELARAYRELVDGGWKGNRIAAHVGRTPAHISQTLALLDLKPELMARVDARALAPSTALKLNGLTPADLAAALRRLDARGKLSRSEAARAVGPAGDVEEGFAHVVEAAFAGVGPRRPAPEAPPKLNGLTSSPAEDGAGGNEKETAAGPPNAEEAPATPPATGVARPSTPPEFRRNGPWNSWIFGVDGWNVTVDWPEEEDAASLVDALKAALNRARDWAADRDGVP